MKVIPKVILALLIISASCNSQGQIRLDINLSSNDCINCIIGLGSIDHISKSVEVTILSDSKNQTVLPEIIQQYIQNPASIRVKYTTSNKKQISSTFTIYDKNKTIHTASLKDIQHYTSFINQLANLKEFNKIPITGDPLRLSDRSAYFMADSQFIACDYLTGYGYDVSFKRAKQAQTQKLSFDNSFIEILRDSLKIPIELFEYVRPFQKQLGKSDFRFKSGQICQDHINIGFSLNFPTIEENGDTALTDFNFIGQVYNNTIRSVLFLDSINTLNKNNHSKDIDDSFIISNDSILYTPLFKSAVDDQPNYLFSKSDIVNGKVINEQFITVTRPHLYDSLKYNHNFGTIGMNKEFAFLRSYPLVYSFEADSEIDFCTVLESYFKKKYADRVFPFYFLDWKKLGDRIYAAIIQQKEKCSIVYFDILSQKILYQTEIDSKAYELSSIRFNSKGIVCVSKDKLYVFKN